MNSPGAEVELTAFTATKNQDLFCASLELADDHHYNGDHLRRRAASGCLVVGVAAVSEASVVSSVFATPAVEPGHWNIEQLTTRTDYRRRGVATDVVEELARTVPLLGARVLAVDATSRAAGVYQAAGFEQDGPMKFVRTLN